MVISRLSNLKALYLHRTSLGGGSIPNEMRSLTNLEEILLKETDVKSTVLKSVCSLREKGSLRELEIDCRGTEPWVECGCCSKCWLHHWLYFCAFEVVVVLLEESTCKAFWGVTISALSVGFIYLAWSYANRNDVIDR